MTNNDDRATVAKLEKQLALAEDLITRLRRETGAASAFSIEFSRAGDGSVRATAVHGLGEEQRVIEMIGAVLVASGLQESGQ